MGLCSLKICGKEGGTAKGWCEVKGVPGRRWEGGGEGGAAGSRRRVFVGRCRSLLRAPGTRGHECLSTVRYDAWITPLPFDGVVPRHGVPPLQPFPLPPSLAAFAIWLAPSHLPSPAFLDRQIYRKILLASSRRAKSCCTWHRI